MKILRQILGPLLALLLTFGSVAEVYAPITIAATGVVLGVGHAQAATRAQKAVVLNGVPGWVLRVNGVLPSVDMDFVHNRAWAGGVGVRAPPQFLTTVRASTGYAQWADGHLSGFGSNIPRITDLGLLVEEARTNVVLWNRDLTNAAWTKSNITAALNQTGADGTANSATSLTATAGNGTCLQAITLASSARFQSAYVKRLTGSGVINMTLDNGATWTAITVTAAYTKLTIPTQTLANPTVGFRIVTSGDAIAVDFVQNENGAFATSPIAATTVAVTRAADTITLAGAALVLARPASGWLVAKLPLGAASQSYTLVRKVSPSDAYLFAQSSSVASALVASSGVANATIGGGGTFAGSVRYALTWDGTGIANVANGGTISSTATPFGATDGSSMYLGSSGSGNNSINSYISRIAIGNTRLTNAQLQALAQ